MTRNVLEYARSVQQKDTIDASLAELEKLEDELPDVANCEKANNEKRRIAGRLHDRKLQAMVPTAKPADDTSNADKPEKQDDDSQDADSTKPEDDDAHAAKPESQEAHAAKPESDEAHAAKPETHNEDHEAAQPEDHDEKDQTHQAAKPETHESKAAKPEDHDAQAPAKPEHHEEDTSKAATPESDEDHAAKPEDDDAHAAKPEKDEAHAAKPESHDADERHDTSKAAQPESHSALHVDVTIDDWNSWRTKFSSKISFVAEARPQCLATPGLRSFATSFVFGNNAGDFNYMNKLYSALDLAYTVLGNTTAVENWTKFKATAIQPN
jgi:hypothetical protein